MILNLLVDKPREKSPLWLLVTGGTSKPLRVVLNLLVDKPRDKSPLWLLVTGGTSKPLHVVLNLLVDKPRDKSPLCGFLYFWSEHLSPNCP